MWFHAGMRGIDIELLEEEWDEDLRPPPGKKYSVAAEERIRQDERGRVVAVDRGRVTVLFDGDLHEATFAGSMRGTKVVVGDRVRLRPPRHDGDTARVTERLDRDTVLVRTSDDAIREERVVVANADQVVIMIAADYLDGGARFVDRVLVAAEHGRLDAIVCINKMDLVDAGAEGGGSPELVQAVDELVARYEAIGYEVLRTSAVADDGVQELNWRLEGCWTTMTGHSGVGKSSVYNRLIPHAEQEIGDIGRRGGRHTTVAARAEPVPGHDDAWLVDTPGVRSFGLGYVDEHELPGLFPELRGLPCELDDCLHDGEPGCALEQARIHPDRLASYRRFLSAIRGDDRWERDEWSRAQDDEQEADA